MVYILRTKKDQKVRIMNFNYMTLEEFIEYDKLCQYDKDGHIIDTRTIDYNIGTIMNYLMQPDITMDKITELYNKIKTRKEIDHNG